MLEEGLSSTHTSTHKSISPLAVTSARARTHTHTTHTHHTHSHTHTHTHIQPHTHAHTHARAQIIKDNEVGALVEGLNGTYIEPGPGGDPIRNPNVLPTGKNIHALDPQSIPTAVGYYGSNVFRLNLI